MKLQIVTPQGVIYSSDNADSVTLPTSTGIITVEEDHVPLMSLITPGEVVVYGQDGETYSLAISKGVIEISRPTVVRILADTAERAEDIDIERAEEARKRALELREQSETEANINYTALQAKIEKELARVQVGKKWKKVRT